MTASDVVENMSYPLRRLVIIKWKHEYAKCEGITVTFLAEACSVDSPFTI